MNTWADNEKELNKKHWRFNNGCMVRTGRVNPYDAGTTIVLD